MLVIKFGCTKTLRKRFSEKFFCSNHSDLELWIPLRCWVPHLKVLKFIELFGKLKVHYWQLWIGIFTYRVATVKLLKGVSFPMRNITDTFSTFFCVTNCIQVSLTPIRILKPSIAEWIITSISQPKNRRNRSYLNNINPKHYVSWDSRLKWACNRKMSNYT